MNEVIEHRGVVMSVDGGHVVVKIMQASACNMCKARSFCASNENREKLIDVYDNMQTLDVGKEVTVCEAASSGWRAVWWTSVLPLIIVVTVLIVVLQFTKSEPVAAISGIVALIPYYGMLYIMRGRMKRQIRFWIKSGSPSLPLPRREGKS